jgi:ClpP class serine protease
MQPEQNIANATSTDDVLTDEDYETIDKDTDHFFEETFPEIWAELRQDIKDSSKREVAEVMYKLGISMHMKYMADSFKKAQDSFEKNPEEFKTNMEEFSKQIEQG